MPRPTTEQMFEWANNPPEWQYLGFATSEDELAELREFAVAERRKFLLDAALAQIAVKSAADSTPTEDVESTLSKEADFSDIPLRLVLSLEECVAISKVCAEADTDEADFNKRWIWQERDVRRIWKEYATTFAFEHGFSYAHSKHTHIKPEKKKEKFSEFWTRPSVPFLMHGITRIAEASMDLEALQLLTDDYENDVNAFARAPHPLRFWQRIIEEKRQSDESLAKTYADVVEPMADGVYVAHYLDEAIMRSGNYVSIDEYYKAAIELGDTLQAASTGFTKIIRALAPDYRYNEWYMSQRVLPAGAVFFEKKLLPNAREAVGEFGRNKGVIAVIDKLLGVTEDTERFTDDEYRQIVFGE